MKKFILTFACALSFLLCAFAQQRPAITFVHENHVKPAMTEKYRESVKKLKEACMLHKIKLTWRTIAFDDNSFVHIFPIESMAALEQNLFAELEQKAGKETVANLAAAIESCVESKVQRIVTSMPEYSYLDPAEGENYRMVLHIVPIPGKEAEMEKVFMEWKTAFTAAKSTENYHLYRLTFGEDAGYLVSLSAKDAGHMFEKRNKTVELMGDITAKLFQKQSALTRKHYWRRGYVAPALSYSDVAVN